MCWFCLLLRMGLGLVMAEAMACGCPVISSTNCGGDDLYTDGVEGFVVPIRDAKAIADRMQMLADQPELRREMGAAALKRVRSLGGWTDYGDQWEKLLLQLTSVELCAANRWFEPGLVMRDEGLSY